MIITYVSKELIQLIKAIIAPSQMEFTGEQKKSLNLFNYMNHLPVSQYSELIGVIDNPELLYAVDRTKTGRLVLHEVYVIGPLQFETTRQLNVNHNASFAAPNYKRDNDTAAPRQDIANHLEADLLAFSSGTSNIALETHEQANADDFLANPGWPTTIPMAEKKQESDLNLPDPQEMDREEEVSSNDEDLQPFYPESDLAPLASASPLIQETARKEEPYSFGYEKRGLQFFVPATEQVTSSRNSEQKKAPTSHCLVVTTNSGEKHQRSTELDNHSSKRIDRRTRDKGQDYHLESDREHERTLNCRR